MLKTIALFGLSLLSLLPVHAQRLDLDRASFPYAYRGLPERPQLGYDTYYVEVRSTPSLRAIYPDQDVVDRINIVGWNKINTKSHVKVHIDMSDMLIDGTRVISRVSERKDKDGRVISSVTYYKMEVTYSFAVSVNVSNYLGQIIKMDQLLGRGDKKVYTTEEYTKSYEASSFWYNNKETLIAQLTHETMDKLFSDLSQNLTNLIGFDHVRGQDYLWIVDSEKHPEYSRQQSMHQLVRSVFAKMTDDAPVEPLKSELMPAIEYFESIAVDYKNDSKADAKIRYGALYNLALIHFYLEEFTPAKLYATRLIENDFDPKDGERIQEMCDRLMANLAACQKESRHFIIDLSNATGPR